MCLSCGALLFFPRKGVTMNGIDWGKIIQTVLEAVLALALPVVVGYVATWLRAQRAALLAKLSDREREILLQAVEIAVRAAEQSGLAGYISDVAESKKRFALEAAERYLANFGLVMDLDVLSDMIESEVRRQFGGGEVSALPAGDG